MNLSVFDIASISSGLSQGRDGIWRSLESKNISYPSDGHHNYFDVEADSFWFKHRNRCIITVVKTHPPLLEGPIFDIGGGNGFVSWGLVRAGFDSVLVEPGSVGAKNAKKRGLGNIVCATIESARFSPGALPAVGLFDVIEHVDDDVAFLRSINELLPERGRLYATVPAHSFLWSTEDVSAGHCRRYSLGQICSVVESAGFEVEFASYIFRFLPVPIFLFRALPHKLSFPYGKTKAKNSISRDHTLNSRFLNKLLNHALDNEIRKLETNRIIHFGGSCLLVARSAKLR